MPAGCSWEGARLASRHVAFYLANDFSMLAFSSAIEPLRLANRCSESDYYQWSVVTDDGEPVRASNGLSVSADMDLKTVQHETRNGVPPDLFFVVAGIDARRRDSPALRDLLRAIARRARAVGGLCTGAWMLAKAGLLDGRRCAIHWEDLPGFTEHFPEADVQADLCEIDGNIYTCAGGTAALDMMMHIIQQDFGEDIVARVCEQCLIDRTRDLQDRQRLPLGARIGHHDGKLLSIVQMMEANIAEPLPLELISARVGLSRRHIERLFRLYLKRSPARYYLELRLDRARHLLRQTNLPIIEIAIACGFVSASHFSKCFREVYGRSPQAERGKQTGSWRGDTSRVLAFPGTEADKAS